MLSFFYFSQCTEENFNENLTFIMKNMTIGGKFIFLEKCPRFTGIFLILFLYFAFNIKIEIKSNNEYNN